MKTQVFFIRKCGSITLAAAPRNTFKESLRFKKVHEDSYQSFGFELLGG